MLMNEREALGSMNKHHILLFFLVKTSRVHLKIIKNLDRQGRTCFWSFITSCLHWQ